MVENVPTLVMPTLVMPTCVVPKPTNVLQCIIWHAQRKGLLSDSKNVMAQKNVFS